MKLIPVTKLHKGNKTASKKIDDEVMPRNCDVIVIFQIYGQFRAIRKSDSGRIVCKTYVFINSNLSLTQTENRTKNSPTQLSHCYYE